MLSRKFLDAHTSICMHIYICTYTHTCTYTYTNVVLIFTQGYQFYIKTNLNKGMKAWQHCLFNLDMLSIEGRGCIVNHYLCLDSLWVLSQHRLFFPTIKAHPWRRACPPKPQCRLSFPGLLQPPSFQSRHVLNILVLIRYLRAKIKTSFIYCGRGRLWLVKTTFTACFLIMRYCGMFTISSSQWQI